MSRTMVPRVSSDEKWICIPGLLAAQCIKISDHGVQYVGYAKYAGYLSKEKCRAASSRCTLSANTLSIVMGMLNARDVAATINAASRGLAGELKTSAAANRARGEFFGQLQALYILKYTVSTTTGTVSSNSSNALSASETITNTLRQSIRSGKLTLYSEQLSHLIIDRLSTWFACSLTNYRCLLDLIRCIIVTNSISNTGNSNSNSTSKWKISKQDKFKIISHLLYKNGRAPNDLEEAKTFIDLILASGFNKDDPETREFLFNLLFRHFHFDSLVHDFFWRFILSYLPPERLQRMQPIEILELWNGNVGSMTELLALWSRLVEFKITLPVSAQQSASQFRILPSNIEITIVAWKISQNIEEADATRKCLQILLSQPYFQDLTNKKTITESVHLIPFLS